jgi:quinol-cytochrome oxidoreductase complex cytochrome b subunit
MTNPNPYESPSDASRTDDRPLFSVPIIEVAIVIFIIVFIVGILLPAVEAASRLHHDRPPGLVPEEITWPYALVVFAVSLASPWPMVALLAMLRRALPPKYKDYLVWEHQQRERTPVERAFNRVMIVLFLVGTLTLVVLAALHAD